MTIIVLFYILYFLFFWKIERNKNGSAKRSQIEHYTYSLPYGLIKFITKFSTINIPTKDLDLLIPAMLCRPSAFLSLRNAFRHGRNVMR